jgi:CHASE2 domain-containing sensor protein
MRTSLQKLGIRLFFVAIWALFLLLCTWQAMPERAWGAAYIIVAGMGVVSAVLCLQEMWAELNGTPGAEPNRN